MKPTPALITPSQTVGPFFHPGLLRADVPGNQLALTGAHGERIRVEGRVFDGEGAPVPDAVLEVWQADASGRYRHPADWGGAVDSAFLGFGRAGTDDEGRYWFATVKPGAVPFDGARMQAPHIGVTLFARGLLNHVLTRVYFADEPANDADPVLRLVSPERRATLLAQRAEASGGVYRFDIVLQGRDETVFFNPR